MKNPRPRPPTLGHASAHYLHVLDRDTNHTLLVIPYNPGFLSDDLSQHDAEAPKTFRRFCTQLAERLHGGLFVNRFALIHPELVRPGASGSPRG